MGKKYSSKVSYGLLIFIFLTLYGSLIPELMENGLSEKMIGVTGFISLVFVFVLHLFFGTSYTIDADKVRIKCGLFSYKPIEVAQITEISKTNSVISSPAPSFDRIKIKYGKFSSVIISPKDKLDFAASLTKINSNIENKITE